MDMDPPVAEARDNPDTPPPPDNLREQVRAALEGGRTGPRHGPYCASNGTEELDLRSDPGEEPRGVDAEGDTFMSSARGVDEGAMDEWFCPVGGCG